MLDPPTLISARLGGLPVQGQPHGPLWAHRVRWADVGDDGQLTVHYGRQFLSALPFVPERAGGIVQAGAVLGKRASGPGGEGLEAQLAGGYVFGFLALLLAIQAPVPLHAGHPKPVNVADVIQNDGRRPVIFRTQRPPDLLQPQGERHGGAQQYGSGAGRYVHPFRNQFAARQNVETTIGQRRDEVAPHSLRHRSVDVGGFPPGSAELLGDLSCMRSRNAKSDGWPTV